MRVHPPTRACVAGGGLLVLLLLPSDSDGWTWGVQTQVPWFGTAHHHHRRDHLSWVDNMAYSVKHANIGVWSELMDQRLPKVGVRRWQNIVTPNVPCLLGERPHLRGGQRACSSRAQPPMRTTCPVASCHTGTAATGGGGGCPRNDGLARALPASRSQF